MTQDIPSEVLDGIRHAAKTDWPGDREMQQHVIDSETEAYHALRALDFGEALPFKQAILDEASQYNETWEDRFNAVQGEVEAFAELATLSPDDVPADMLAGMKQRAAVEHDADSDESGHRFRSKADSVPIDCGQHSDDPGQERSPSTAGRESRRRTGVKA